MYQSIQSWFRITIFSYTIHDVQHFDLSDVVSVYCLYPQSPCLSSPTSSPAPARINKEGEWTRRDQRTTSYAEQFLREVEMLHSSGSSSGRHGRVNWHFYNDCPAAAAAGQCGGGAGAVVVPCKFLTFGPNVSGGPSFSLSGGGVCTLH